MTKETLDSLDSQEWQEMKGYMKKHKGKAEFTIKSCFVKEKKKKKRMKCNLQLYLIASFFEGQFICENVGFKVPSSVFLYIYFLRFPLVYFLWLKITFIN